jgi:hypothetical protein
MLEDRAAATVGAVLIPLRALTLGVGASERFHQWEPVVLELARIEQLIDDVVDWQQDAEAGQPNRLVAEAARRAEPGEAPAAWVIRAGYRWGLDTARMRLDRLEPLAVGLGSVPLLGFFAARREAVASLERATAAGLAQLASLAPLFPPDSA